MKVIAKFGILIALIGGISSAYADAGCKLTMSGTDFIDTRINFEKTTIDDVGHEYVAAVNTADGIIGALVFFYPQKGFMRVFWSNNQGVDYGNSSGYVTQENPAATSQMNVRKRGAITSVKVTCNLKSI